MMMGIFTGYPLFIVGPTPSRALWLAIRCHWLASCRGSARVRKAPPIADRRRARWHAL